MVTSGDIYVKVGEDVTAGDAACLMASTYAWGKTGTAVSNAYYYKHGDSYYFIRSQLIWAVIGVVAMIAISYFDYHHLHKLAVPILGLSFVLLIVVLFMPMVNGVHRWIPLGPIGFQASEITKFAIVLSFAHFISINFKRMGTFRYGVLPYGIILVLTAFLLYGQE